MICFCNPYIYNDVFIQLQEIFEQENFKCYNLIVTFLLLITPF